QPVHRIAPAGRRPGCAVGPSGSDGHRHTVGHSQARLHRRVARVHPGGLGPHRRADRERPVSRRAGGDVAHAARRHRHGRIRGADRCRSWRAENSRRGQSRRQSRVSVRIPGLYRFGGLYVLALLLVVFSLLLPETFPTVLNFRTMLVSQSFLAIAAVGLLFAAINGEFDLSIGFLSGFVGALVAWLSIDHGWPAIAAALAGMVTAALVGVINGFLVVKIGIMSFIATLGTGTVLSGLT